MDIGCSLPPQEELHPEDVVPPRLLKKHKPKQVTHTHTHMHACMHTHTHMHTNTHTCMHAHTHTPCSQVQQCLTCVCLVQQACRFHMPFHSDCAQHIGGPLLHAQPDADGGQDEVHSKLDGSTGLWCCPLPGPLPQGEEGREWQQVYEDG